MWCWIEYILSYKNAGFGIREKLKLRLNSRISHLVIIEFHAEKKEEKSFKCQFATGNAGKGGEDVLALSFAVRRFVIQIVYVGQTYQIFGKF